MPRDPVLDSSHIARAGHVAQATKLFLQNRMKVRRARTTVISTTTKMELREVEWVVTGVGTVSLVLTAKLALRVPAY
jgi:hypothetical protein